MAGAAGALLPMPKLTSEADAAMQGLKMRQEATKIKLDAAATKLLNAEKASLADAKDKAAHLLAMQAAVHAQEKATREAGQNAAKLSEQDTKARDAAEVKFSAALQAKNKTEAELEHKIEEQNRLGGEESKKAELKFQVKMATLKRSQGKIEEEQKKQKETVTLSKNSENLMAQVRKSMPFFLIFQLNFD